MTVAGHIHNGMVVPDQPLSLPNGTRVLIETVTESVDFWQSPSLENLAQQQDISVSSSVEDFLGGWPTEELGDDFELAVAQWRGAELEHGR